MKVLIATDTTPNGGAAVRAAAHRNWPRGTALRVVSVIESPPIIYPVASEFVGGTMYESTPEARKEVEDYLVKQARRVRRLGLKISHTVLLGLPADEIIKAAKVWDADLIMVGSRGQRRFSRFLLGSVALRVASLAPCSVEIVREDGGKAKLAGAKGGTQ